MRHIETKFIIMPHVQGICNQISRSQSLFGPCFLFVVLPISVNSHISRKSKKGSRSRQFGTRLINDTGF